MPMASIVDFVKALRFNRKGFIIGNRCCYSDVGFVLKLAALECLI